MEVRSRGQEEREGQVSLLVMGQQKRTVLQAERTQADRPTKPWVPATSTSSRQSIPSPTETAPRITLPATHPRAYKKMGCSECQAGEGSKQKGGASRTIPRHSEGQEGARAPTEPTPSSWTPGILLLMQFPQRARPTGPHVPTP